MENEVDVTREQIDETRASLAEKLETLEQQVVDTVHGAADAVTQTVSNVTDTFDIRLHVKRHPWAMLGGAMALGCLGGYLMFRRASPPLRMNPPMEPAREYIPPIVKQKNLGSQDHLPAQEANALNSGRSVESRFAAELTVVKEIAIGALLGVARDIVTQKAPEMMKVGLANVIDGLTVKMGGEPIHAPAPKSDSNATWARDGRINGKVVRA